MANLAFDHRLVSGEGELKYDTTTLSAGSHPHEAPRCGPTVSSLSIAYPIWISGLPICRNLPRPITVFCPPRLTRSLVMLSIGFVILGKFSPAAQLAPD